MSPSEPPVLVAVVSYNSAADLPGLLESLPAGMAGVPWRTVVVDNGSTDDSIEVVRRCDPGALAVGLGRNGGYAAGINAAVAAADGPFRAVLVLNPDVRLAPGCVPTLLAAFDDPSVGIAVPFLRDARGARIDSMRREPTLARAVADALIGAQRAGRHPWLGEVVTDDRLYRESRDTDWSEGSTQLISARCWETCGGWDESFFLYSEEADYDLRARDAGLVTRFVPGAEAVHLEGGSATSVRMWPLLVVNRLRLYRRRSGPARALLFWLALVLREGSRAALGKPTSRASLRVLLNPARLREPAGPAWLR